MAFVGGLAFARVDADQLGAVALGHLGVAPEVQVAGDGVAAPDQDQLGLGKKLHPHANLASQRLHQALTTGGGADGTVQQRGSQLVEEARCHAVALYQAHGPGVAVGQDGLWVSRGNGLQAACNVAQGLVPAHTHKLARALRSAALERVQDAFGVVGALGVARDLGTQRAVGVAVSRVTVDLGGNAILHRGDQGAGVGAVVGAGTQHFLCAGYPD